MKSLTISLEDTQDSYCIVAECYEAFIHLAMRSSSYEPAGFVASRPSYQLFHRCLYNLGLCPKRTGRVPGEAPEVCYACSLPRSTVLLAPAFIESVRGIRRSVLQERRVGAAVSHVSGIAAAPPLVAATERLLLSNNCRAQRPYLLGWRVEDQAPPGARVCTACAWTANNTSIPDLLGPSSRLDMFAVLLVPDSSSPTHYCSLART